MFLPLTVHVFASISPYILPQKIHVVNLLSVYRIGARLVGSTMLCTHNVAPDVYRVSTCWGDDFFGAD